MKKKSKNLGKNKIIPLKKKYLSIIGIILFIIILRNIDLNTASGILTNVKIDILLLSFILQLTNVLIKSEKWRLLISTFNSNYKKARCAKVWLISYSIGIITPARIGDFTRAIYLKNDTNLSYGKTTSTVFIDRLLDTIALFMLAYLGLILFNPLLTTKPEIKTAITIALVAFAIITTIILKKNVTTLILRPFFNNIIKEKDKKNIKSNYEDFYKSIKIMAKEKKTIVISSLLTLISWIILLISSYLIALSIDINVNIVYFIVLMPIIFIVELVPISISGIGTRDATSILLFSLINITAESAFIFSTLILITNMIFVLIGLVLMQTTYSIQNQIQR